MVFFTLLLASVVFCFLGAWIMLCSPLWWCAYCRSGSHSSLFRFLRPALEPVTRAFGFRCSNMHPRTSAISVLAVYCCMTKQHKILWLKIIIYLLFFLGACELSGLWWVLFPGSPHAASLRLRWASPESSGGWSSRVICLHTGRWHWLLSGSSARAAEQCTWACSPFLWHGVWVLRRNVPRTMAPRGRNGGHLSS